nr:hypothetical protein [Tanacetum cinerariifolium]
AHAAHQLIHEAADAPEPVGFVPAAVAADAPDVVEHLGHGAGKPAFLAVEKHAVLRNLDGIHVVRAQGAAAHRVAPAAHHLVLLDALESQRQRGPVAHALVRNNALDAARRVGHGVVFEAFDQALCQRKRRARDQIQPPRREPRPRVEPARRHHHGQFLHDVADNLERRRPRPDDNAGPQHRQLRLLGLPQYVLHRIARAQVHAQTRIVGYARE